MNPFPVLGFVVMCCFIAMVGLVDKTHAQADASDDIVVVPAALPVELLQAATPSPSLEDRRGVSVPAVQVPAVQVEVVKPSWWEDLWQKVLFPLLGAGGGYLGIWFFVMGRKLLAAQAVRIEERKDEVAVARDTNQQVSSLTAAQGARAVERVAEVATAQDTNQQVHELTGSK